jgi:hypothetical protein
MGSGDSVGGNAIVDAGIAGQPDWDTLWGSLLDPRGGYSDEEDQGSPCSDPTRVLRYISNSVSSNDVSSSARRLKRDHKRLMQQRWTAMELDVSPSLRCDLPPSPGMIGRNLQRRKAPVLEPSTFVLENFDTNEWIMVLRH